ncbi:MAG: radical SAM family heme chaperone HemW [Candidatus Kapabacteria bacterium]|nr:radical SAM family heme chaperone HemW [Ignavibacteriota bacterium]MCW5885672.1 radical SAM family heme chaperone HemW [Candidatus Kapabacteria bacterium]
MKKYGIYIHFPYCVHKCSYCDFYSIENLNSRNKFTKLLTKEIEMKFAEFSDEILVDSIFIGGGTPSLMKPHHIEPVFKIIRDNVTLTSDCEITMECNPGTIDVKFLTVYKELGVNRISFGVQSFIEAELKFLERIHSKDDIAKSVKLAREVGFSNISIDLMFALPNQTPDNWYYNLNKAIELETNHISAYSLIYEPGTPLYEDYKSGKIVPQNDESDSELYFMTNEVLSKAGFMQYEVSNYAKSGSKCRHNLRYWSGDEYFGFGPSAHSYIGERRAWNYRSNDKYFQSLENGNFPIEGFEDLSRNQMIFEKIYLGLRAEGINFDEFANFYKIDLFKCHRNYIEKLISEGFAELNSGILKLTNKGYFTGDNITVKFASAIE